MKMLMLRFTKLNNVDGDWWDSNLIILNGPSGVHIEMPGTGNSATTMQSMTGMKFVSNYQDYFGEVWDKDIPYIGFGQVIKFRVRKLPDYAVVMGDIEDGGDVNPDDPDDILNAFAGKEKEYFRGNNSELLLGKNKVTS